jgi:phage-related protein
MKTPEVFTQTDHNETSITRTLAAARELRGQVVPQRKMGSGRPRKVTSSVLKT